MNFDAIIEDALSNRLGDSDIADLAWRLARSGTILEVSGPTADLASTGGPGSLSTLVGPLLLVQAGRIVPKLGVAGRPAGGIDVMSLVPGYRTRLRNSELIEAIAVCGYAHVVAGDEHAPADGTLFQLRQARGAQANADLATASLLSKKLAMGVRSMLLDVRVAPFGNFGAEFDTARENARRFRRIAAMLGIDARCVLNDGTVASQPFIGRSEALRALDDLFSDESGHWLGAHFADVSNWVAEFLGKSERAATATSVADVFRKNLSAQGSSWEAFQRAVAHKASAPRFMITASEDGPVEVDLGRLRSALVEDQGKPKGPMHADGAGAVLHVRPGEWIEKGQLVMTVRLDSGAWNRRRSVYQACIIAGGDRAPRQAEVVRD